LIYILEKQILITCFLW